MPGPTLTIDELAEELGLTPRYLRKHWGGLVAKGLLPAPISFRRAPHIWSRAHVYAYIDRKLPRELRAAAAAQRAAFAAYTDTPMVAQQTIAAAEWEAQLNHDFAPREDA